MEIVVLDGVEYTKASVVARHFRYTSDYIGQLCRGKKVDARLVGRTWFVNTQSLIDHKHGKYSKQKIDISYKPETAEVTNIHVSVSPTIKSKTSRLLNNSTELDKPSSSRRLRVYYEMEEGNLIPKITKKHTRQPKTIRIQQADAQNVRVGGETKLSSFIPDQLPEVALSGKLSIEELQESEVLVTKGDSVSDTNKNIAIMSDVEAINTSIIPNSVKAGGYKTGHLLAKKAIKFSRNIPLKNKNQRISLPASNDTTDSTSKSPKGMNFTPNSLKQQQPLKTSTAVLISPLIATLLASVVVTALFSASLNVEVSDNSYNSRIVLQLANLIQFIQQ